MTTTSRIDFTQPQDPAAPRLRHAFRAPRRVLVAATAAEVRKVLDAVHAAAARGQWCVGYVRYEAAAAFDAALQTHGVEGAGGQSPWPGLRCTTDPSPGPQTTVRRPPRSRGRTPSAAATSTAPWPSIQQAIGAGELYQVNYTAPLHGTLQGSASGLFAALQRAQPGGYAAHIDTGGDQVLSVSPELFFDWCDAPDGGAILARPMKGTAPRGATPEADAAVEARLRASAKERAENVMIVDLLRNDLSRIAVPYSVRVPACLPPKRCPRCGR